MYMKKIIFLLLAVLVLVVRGLQAQNPCLLDVQIAPPDTISCQSPTVQLHATVTPPGNYTLQWYGPEPIGNTLNPVVSTPGVYALYAYDSLAGCWGGDTVVVQQNGTIPAVAIASQILGCADTVRLFAQATPVIDYDYLWSNGATDSVIQVTSSGSYCVTVTNTTSGCQATRCFTLVFPSPSSLEANLFYFNSAFCFDSTVIYVAPTGGQAPYSYQWNTGNTTGAEFDPLPGTYIVTITDAYGCSTVATQVVEDDPMACARVSGFVRADWNLNCSSDAGDTGLSGNRVEFVASDGTVYYAYTDNAGYYSIRLEPDTYTASPIAPNNLWLACPASVNMTLTYNQTVTQDFLLQPQANCPAMTVDLTNSNLRRCFNGHYWVQYCNQGTVEATNAYVEITFDPLITVTSAQIGYTDLGSNVYRFDLGAVPFNTCGNFWINVHVSCDAVLGQTKCAEAIIYPIGTCEPPNAQWSGASLAVSSQCLGDSLQFTIQNVGLAPMSTPLDYVVIEDAVMLMQAPPPAIILAPAETHKIKVPASGATWRLEVEQEPFHPGNSHPSLSVEGCATAGGGSTGFINQYAADDDDPWVDIECNTITGSYDPNDKMGLPLGYGATHYIQPGTDIEYRIHFQNTGNDTAFTVVVRDELSPWLDAATVVPGASSHPYTFEYYNERNIKFSFENIQLPDSSVNFDASQGYVSFRVSQKPGVPLETDILNTAGIYFDFNEPVYTNTTVHRVGDQFVVVGTWQAFQPGLELRVSPNPVTASAVFELPGLTEWQAELCDIAGRPLRSARVNGPQWQFVRGDLPAGIYLLRVRASGRVLGTGKVILK